MSGAVGIRTGGAACVYGLVAQTPDAMNKSPRRRGAEWLQAMSGERGSTGSTRGWRLRATARLGASASYSCRLAVWATNSRSASGAVTGCSQANPRHRYAVARPSRATKSFTTGASTPIRPAAAPGGRSSRTRSGWNPSRATSGSARVSGAGASPRRRAEPGPQPSGLARCGLGCPTRYESELVKTLCPASSPTFSPSALY